MRKFAPLLLMVSPLLTVAVGHLLLAWQRWEPNNAQPGSLAYFLAIPAKAKRFPLWEPCGSPSFSYRSEMDWSSETYSIQYQTRLSNVALAQNIDHYGRMGGCKYSGAPAMSREGPEMGLGLVCGPDSTELSFVFPRQAPPQPSCLPVLITFTDKLN
jgi:hypothetical protein